MSGKTALARGSYSVPAGRSARVSFKVGPKGLKLIRKHHGKLKTTLKLAPRVNPTLTLRLPRKH
jgi:hypothetical protein